MAENSAIGQIQGVTHRAGRSSPSTTSRRDRRRRARHAARPRRVRQDDAPAHPRRLHPAGRGRVRAQGRGHPRSSPQAPRQHGLPARDAVPASTSSRTSRSACGWPAGESARSRSASSRPSRSQPGYERRRARALGRPDAVVALAARRQPAACPAPRRAALRARSSRSGSRWRRSCAASTARPARRSSTSPTTSARRSPCPTGSSSSTRAGSSSSDPGHLPAAVVAVRRPVRRRRERPPGGGRRTRWRSCRGDARSVALRAVRGRAAGGRRVARATAGGGAARGPRRRRPARHRPRSCLPWIGFGYRLEIAGLAETLKAEVPAEAGRPHELGSDVVVKFGPGLVRAPAARRLTTIQEERVARLHRVHQPPAGVSVEQFHFAAGLQDAWSEEYADDVLVLNMGRTFRTGPEPSYLAVWHTASAGIERIGDWEAVLRQAKPTGSRRRSSSGPASTTRAATSPARARPPAGGSTSASSSISRRCDRDDVRSFYEARRAVSGS